MDYYWRLDWKPVNIVQKINPNRKYRTEVDRKSWACLKAFFDYRAVVSSEFLPPSTKIIVWVLCIACVKLSARRGRHFGQTVLGFCITIMHLPSMYSFFSGFLQKNIRCNRSTATAFVWFCTMLLRSIPKTQKTIAGKSFWGYRRETTWITMSSENHPGRHVYVCLGWGRSIASEHSDRGNPLYSTPGSKGISRIGFLSQVSVTGCDAYRPNWKFWCLTRL